MKKIYKFFLRFFEELPTNIEKHKTLMAEWIAIFRKAPLYKDIKWTKEQKREFNDFWKKNYGKKISSRWHKLYEASNGVHKVDYLPEIIYSTKIEPKFNNYSYCKVFGDKNLNDLFFNEKICGVRTPQIYLFNSYGRFYNSERNLISKQKAVEILGNIGEAVIKPTVDSSSGKNVIIVNMVNGRNVRNGDSVSDILEIYKNNFVVQERIKPHSELSTLYPNSINTFRVTSYIIGDKIAVAPISLRMGGNGGEVDNIHAGGMSIAVSNDGALAKKAYRLGYGDSFKCFEQHPDTAVKFDGYKISFINKLISTAKRLHEMTANIGIISWDLTIDADGDIVVIEANFKGQSVWFPQMLSGESFFGENMADMLNKISLK